MSIPQTAFAFAMVAPFSCTQFSTGQTGGQKSQIGDSNFEPTPLSIL